MSFTRCHAFLLCLSLLSACNSTLTPADRKAQLCSGDLSGISRHDVTVAADGTQTITTTELTPAEAAAQFGCAG